MDLIIFSEILLIIEIRILEIKYIYKPKFGHTANLTNFFCILTLHTIKTPYFPYLYYNIVFIVLVLLNYL